MICVERFAISSTSNREALDLFRVGSMLRVTGEYASSTRLSVAVYRQLASNELVELPNITTTLEDEMAAYVFDVVIFPTLIIATIAFVVYNWEARKPIERSVSRDTESTPTPITSKGRSRKHQLGYVPPSWRIGKSWDD